MSAAATTFEEHLDTNVLCLRTSESNEYKIINIKTAVTFSSEKSGILL